MQRQAEGDACAATTIWMRKGAVIAYNGCTQFGCVLSAMSRQVYCHRKFFNHLYRDLATITAEPHKRDLLLHLADLEQQHVCFGRSAHCIDMDRSHEAHRYAAAHGLAAMAQSYENVQSLND